MHLGRGLFSADFPAMLDGADFAQLRDSAALDALDQQVPREQELGELSPTPQKSIRVLFILHPVSE